jgi:hypothetical protein
MLFLEELLPLPKNWPIIMQGTVYTLYLETAGHFIISFAILSFNNTDNYVDMIL